VKADDAALKIVFLIEEVKEGVGEEEVERSRVRMSPAFSAAPMTVVVSVAVAGKRAFTKVLRSIRTQRSRSHPREKDRYVPRMSTMVRGVPTRARSKVCQSLSDLWKNSAR